MTKKGAITRMRTKPCPHIGWFRRMASKIPKPTVIAKTLQTIMSVVTTEGQKALDVMKRT